MKSILTSLHGRRFGLSKDNDLILNGGPRGDGQEVVIDGIARVTVTSAQLLALNATAQAIVAAPGAGKANVLRFIEITKPAGTAYSGVATGEDMVVKYTNASGAVVSGTIETTGFLDQATSQTRVCGAIEGSYAPVANAALVLHLLTGEIAAGTSDLLIKVHYDVIDVPVVV